MKRLVLAAAIVLSFSSQAADRIKVGFVSTLSGPNGAIGIDIRDGFQLAVQQLGNKFGGLPGEVIVGDDKFTPDVGRQLAEKMVKLDHVNFLTGIVYSPILLATVPQVLNAEIPYISANAGPSQYAGKGCHPYFFNATWQTDVPHEAMGRYLSEKGVSNVLLIAPNFPGGRDAVAGFKRFYKGTIQKEIYTTLGQLDYGVEVSQIRSEKPGAVYFFLPGGMGINFIKQYTQAGLTDIPLYTQAFSADEDTFRGVGGAVVGVFNSAHWSHELDNAANKRFVAAFQKTYHRLPTVYAAQGYDTAMLIDSAVKGVHGNVEDKTALLKSIKAANFQSVRGPFKFGNNNNPVQNFYIRQVVKNAKGEPVNKLIGTVLTNYGDAYADQCAMK
ncbi:MAG TPA: ABC transporter substrate-binding protein [Burkholderiales bacterium]|nr:ABC transporter substrate-binding protein [Burkholderiales bacterium]